VTAPLAYYTASASACGRRPACLLDRRKWPSSRRPPVVHDMTQCFAARWIDPGRRRRRALRDVRPAHVARGAHMGRHDLARSSSSRRGYLQEGRCWCPLAHNNSNGQGFDQFWFEVFGIHGSAWSWSVLEVKTTVSACPWAMGHGDACQCDSDPAREYRAKADKAPPEQQESAQGPCLGRFYLATLQFKAGFLLLLS
jgi:hypothetical protein